MSVITLVASCLVAVVFAWGAIAKLVRFVEWKRVLSGYGIRGPVASLAAGAVPLAELGVVALLIFGHALAGAALTLALLALFSLAFLTAQQKAGGPIPCGCFGRATPTDLRILVARNAGLACLAGIILINGREGVLRISNGSTWTTWLPAALVVAGVAVTVRLSQELAETSRRQ